MKSEYNQSFTSFDFFTLVMSMIIIVGVSGPIIKKNFQPDNSLERAKLDLGRISQEILSPKTLNLMAQNYRKGNIRSVASVDEKGVLDPAIDLTSIQKHLANGEWEGEVGTDPWGKPYHFSFIRNPTGYRTHIAVWSDGPNQKSETSVHSQVGTPENPESLTFKGDDIGAVFPIR